MPWEPGTEAAILAVLPDLQESEMFDAKRQPGPSHKAVDYAVDVAAMANDGGSIVYGIAEPKPGVFMATPFDTSGQAERLSQAIAAHTLDPPRFRVSVVPSDHQPGKGYLVVSVEASPMAPHMVAGKFHGRKGPTNYVLGEGEVNRLYARRRRWEEDAEITLEEAVRRHHDPAIDRIYLTVAIRPLLGVMDLRNRAWPHWKDFVTAVRAAADSVPFVHPADPSLVTYSGFTQRNLTGAIALDQSEGEDARQLAVFRDGRIHLFESRLRGKTTARIDGVDLTVKLIREGSVAQLIAHTLALGHDLFGAASYQGPVVAGVALRRIQGAMSIWTGQSVEPSRPGRIDVGTYRRVERCSTSDLTDPVPMTRRLIGEILDVVLPAGMPDPLAV